MKYTEVPRVFITKMKETGNSINVWYKGNWEMYQIS